MKFYSEPNMYITDFRTKQTVCKFDANGVFETEDTVLIDKLKPHFKHENNTQKEDKPHRQCKKCNFTCETQGELMAHYRANHPK